MEVARKQIVAKIRVFSKIISSDNKESSKILQAVDNNVQHAKQKLLPGQPMPILMSLKKNMRDLGGVARLICTTTVPPPSPKRGRDIRRKKRAAVEEWSLIRTMAQKLKAIWCLISMRRRQGGYEVYADSSALSGINGETANATARATPRSQSIGGDILGGAEGEVVMADIRLRAKA